MLTQAYIFSLGQQVKEKLVTIAKLDGIKPNLICTSIGGKVFIHSPHDNNKESSSDIEFLNINKNIIALSAGNLDSQNSNKEVILMASENTLIAYDVQKNSDLFYKEIQEGIFEVNFGQIDLSENSQPLVFIGGNCLIQGFDKKGDEQYWNVASDNVTSIAFMDIDEDGINEIIIGTDDNYLRILKGDEILLDIIEASKPICIEPLYRDKFAFGLENGSVGVYQKGKRLWRVKSKFRPISLISIEPEQNDKFTALIIGWQNGRIEIRNDNSGEVYYKTQVNSNIAKLLKYDYRLENNQQIICVTVDGNVTGYNLIKKLQQSEKQSILAQSSIGQQVLNINDLNKQKTDLLMELSTLQENQKNQLNKQQMGGGPSIIPPNTKLKTLLKHNFEKLQTELQISANTQCFIRGVIISADQIFQQESISYFPKKQGREVNVPIKVQKNLQTEMDLKVLTGNSPASAQYFIFELTITLPKFSSLMNLDSTSNYQIPSSSVTFNIQERLSRELVGEMIQDLCNYMNVTNLESVANFPVEMQDFNEVLQKVTQYDAARMNISGDIAESIGTVKTFLVKAEDSRILQNMKEMKKMYTNVMIENRKLVQEFIQRNKNHEILLESLKTLNQMINKAGNLRYGEPKQRVVNLCRNAIKTKNIFSLIQIIRTGREN